MEIQRYNIFDLIGGRQNLYHSVILTSYTFDPIFFESFYLPKLRQCGISNVVVLLDASNYDQMLLHYTTFGLQSDRRQYTLIRQVPTDRGVFHPKISMFFGEDAGMLVVGSGNLTYNGFALNEEVWNTFSLKGANSEYLPLFKSVWNYLNNLKLPKSILLKQQLRWMKDNVSWMSAMESIDLDKVILEHEIYRFVSNDSEGSILKKLQGIIRDEKVESITTISPYYDITGHTIKILKKIFMPEEIKCVYSEEGIYPYDLINEKPDWLTLYSWNDVFSCQRSNVHKLHAKIIQFELQSRTILLSGSANVTNAAFSGAGDEACIAIISDSHKNYIKGLGIILNNKSVADGLKLDTLSKPDRISSDFSKNVQIISSEVVDDTLTIIINKPIIIGCKLKILDLNGVELNIYDIYSNNYKIEIKDFILTNCIAVIIDTNYSEISNRSLVINEEDVARFNPNKMLRKLDSLLESNIDWKDNLANILSYLWVDYHPEDIQVNKKGVAAKIKKESVGKSVLSEEFDNIRIGSRQSVLSLPDVRILDFLLSSEKKQKDVEESNNSDDLDSMQDVDNGDNDYNNCEHTIELRKKETTFITCIDNYSRRLRKYYDIRLSELFSKATKFGADIFKKEYYEETNNVNVIDYSRILINIVLMWRELNNAVDKYHGNIHKDFLTNMGKFLLLARKGYDDTHDYAWHKCVEFHKELIVFCLLLIASQDWYGNETIEVKLIILNLLNSCSNSDSINLDEVAQIFKKKLIEMSVVTKPRSMNLIDKTLKEYKVFCQHYDDNTTIREVDFDNPNGNYSYRKGYGFFYVTDITPIHQSNLNNTVYEMSLCHPGFDEIISVIGGRRIRALS